MATSAFPSVRMKSGIMCCEPDEWMIELQPSWMQDTLVTDGGAYGAGQTWDQLHWRRVHACVTVACWQHLYVWLGASRP